MQEQIDAAFESGKASMQLVSEFLDELDGGRIRAAEPAGDSWKVNEWVKKGILLAFRSSGITEYEFGGFRFFDKQAFPVKVFSPLHEVRIVPGGTSIRRGAFLDKGVVVMPPSYVNVGARVGKGTMVDSHVLVGSCAQIGENVHLSAGTQIGGVLEPIGSLPVIVEDNAFIGGNCGIFEGVLVRKGAVLAPGVQLTRSTPLFDCVNGKEVPPTGGRLEIPENAVVVCGSRERKGKFDEKHGLSSYAALIVKYRDSKTDSSIALEDALR